MFPPMFDATSNPKDIAEAITTHGLAVLRSVVNGELLDSTIRDYSTLYPAWDEYVENSTRHGRPEHTLRADDEEFQAHGPFGKAALDHIPLLPMIMDIVDMILGSETVLLQSHLWAKYGQLGATFDLPLHADYSNHTLVYPSDDPRFMTLHGIAYYSNVGLSDGPTYVVSREATRDISLVPYDKLRVELPDLYRREVPVLVPAGSVMLYSAKMFHRASTMNDRNALRLSHFFAYGSPDVPWLGWGRFLCAKPGLARQAFVERCPMAQLGRIGFPSPESEYWTDETIAGTSLIYSGLDLETYLRGSW
jgi:ectoine hydroxylase-related dioxygenase (phytanoyl-CoA dioxygenase family)